MVKRILLMLLVLPFLGEAFTAHRVVKLMGTRFEFVAIHESEEFAEQAIDLAIAEIDLQERMISSWKKESFTSQINLMAGSQKVRVPKEIYDLIQRSIKVSELTEGAFDITIGPVLKEWRFEGVEFIPDSNAVQRALRYVGYQNISLSKEQGYYYVFLEKKGMTLDFGAIGKGYAANVAKKVMMEQGIENGMVSASGDLICWGSPEEDPKWKVAIVDPFDQNAIAQWLEVGDESVVTSGDYEKFLLIDSVRYSHIINPKTGFPTKGIASVSILCPDPELGDALATSVFVLGKNKGLALINEVKGVECIIYDAEGNEWRSNFNDLEK